MIPPTLEFLELIGEKTRILSGKYNPILSYEISFSIFIRLIEPSIGKKAKYQKKDF
jgi:hypothetical protein